MKKKFIDLSLPMDNNIKEFSPPYITYKRHDETVKRASIAFGINSAEWPEGKAWATEEITLTTHTGTHIDAPYHYWDKTGENNSKKVDDLPLDWFYNDGVLL